MAWDAVERNWTQLRGKVIERWGSFTDDELLRIEGQREQLVALLQEKHGTPREEAERQADAWAESVRLSPPG